jgi:protein ImuB
MILCFRTATWPEHKRDDLIALFAEAVPRMAVSQLRVWVDARGLDAKRMATRLCGIGESHGVVMHAGISAVPIAADVAAGLASADPIVVPLASEREFLSSQPLSTLEIDERLQLLLTGVGIETCGELAVLERESVEVRFGPPLLTYWHWARAEDDRRLFAPVPPAAPHASLEFLDYVITDPERLIFSVNALFGGICDELTIRGTHARRIKLTLSLANQEKWERVLRPARPSASRVVWLRLTRALLERITVSDSVCAIALVVDGTEPASAIQGDLFDAGFATASAVDAVLDRLVEAQGEVMVEPEPSAHPLVEKRSAFVAERPKSWADKRKVTTESGETVHVNVNMNVDDPPGLTLQLLPVPREVLVETVRRRDHHVPIRYRDGQWKQLVTAAGPDRISGGRWDETYAREYFRAVTVDGVLVWLYRDARSDQWFLHGWWD